MAEIFKKAVVVGMGRLGGSIAMALKKYGLARELGAVDTDEVTLKKVFHLGITDFQTADLKDALPGADLVVLAVPVSQVKELFAPLAEGAAEGCLIMDTFPVKGPVVEAAGSLGSARVSFVGAHPVVETSLGGFENAIPGLFRDAVCVLVPFPGASKEAVEEARALWEALGCELLVMDAQMHDRVFSLLNELPVMVLQTLFRTTEMVKGHLKDPDPLFGHGLKDLPRVPDATRQAVLDTLWAGRETNREILGLFRLKLRELSEALETGDPARLSELLFGG